MIWNTLKPIKIFMPLRNIFQNILCIAKFGFGYKEIDFDCYTFLLYEYLQSHCC